MLRVLFICLSFYGSAQSQVNTGFTDILGHHVDDQVVVDFIKKYYDVELDVEARGLWKYSLIGNESVSDYRDLVMRDEKSERMIVPIKLHAKMDTIYSVQIFPSSSLNKKVVKSGKWDSFYKELLPGNISYAMEVEELLTKFEVWIEQKKSYLSISPVSEYHKIHIRVGKKSGLYRIEYSQIDLDDFKED